MEESAIVRPVFDDAIANNAGLRDRCSGAANIRNPKLTDVRIGA